MEGNANARLKKKIAHSSDRKSTDQTYCGAEQWIALAVAVVEKASKQGNLSVELHIEAHT
jgi:hypothetical protein